jgi:hypothetical protein
VFEERHGGVAWRGVAWPRGARRRDAIWEMSSTFEPRRGGKEMLNRARWGGGGVAGRSHRFQARRITGGWLYPPHTMSTKDIPTRVNIRLLPRLVSSSPCQSWKRYVDLTLYDLAGELDPVCADVLRSSPPLSSRRRGSLPPRHPRPGFSNTRPTLTDPATSCSSLTSRASTLRFSPLLLSHRGYARSSARLHLHQGAAKARVRVKARTSRPWTAQRDG